ncbi:hypothetical protein [Methylococcus sp. Mc7]|uniref:hypothetical protein n=1 Tax=Methylococcus sp. Mc7 TaxID=2860258 RepID=UPI001C530EE8|nr:hypothetical protein [Methylococcus sp. Mc7]QXP85199.1 hypothetical protein KW115_05590 [Methylococcus sp. Mc7]
MTKNKYVCLCKALLLLAINNDSLACKDPDFNSLTQMSEQELSQFGCTKDQVTLQLVSRDSKYNEAIELANKLKRRGLLDGPSLRVQADAFYQLGRYSDALAAHLLSTSTPAQCTTFSGCRFEYSTAIDHYENSKYYQANGNIHEAAEELKKGDNEFYKTCRSYNKAKSCTPIRDRILQSINHQFNRQK